MNNKLETLTNLFEGKEIRSIWDSEKEEYYFSVVDVIGALTESQNPRNYWNMLKSRLTDEGSELYTKCVQMKMKAQDGKLRLTDTLDTSGIFRLIESVPSPKAEPLNISSDNVEHIIRTLRSFLEGFSLLVNNNAFGNPISIKESFNLSLDIIINGIKSLEGVK